MISHLILPASGYLLPLEVGALLPPFKKENLECSLKPTYYFQISIMKLGISILDYVASILDAKQEAEQ